MIGIPESGAVFTLGKSCLAENEQSYFFIKNDPIVHLISGSNQSAVICESGRLFVWGENHFGQLGIGNTNEIVTKPTCVKALKSLGHKICDVVFGLGWSVILTHSNGIFFTGRNIFPKESKIFSNFVEIKMFGENFSVIRKPIRLIEFDELIHDDEKFVRICAGDNHFVVLTSQGHLYAWGINESSQLGLADPTLPSKPIKIQVNSKIKNFTCGPTLTLILNENNQIFLAGQMKDYKFEHFTELTSFDQSLIILFIFISSTNEIFFTTENGVIFRGGISTRKKAFKLQQFYDYNNDDYGPVKKLLKGSSFYVVLTTTNKFYTTFSESGHHLKTFREISKFKNLNTLDVAVGDDHILIFGIPKEINNTKNDVLNGNLTVSNEDLNGNIKPNPLNKIIIEETKEIANLSKPNDLLDNKKNTEIIHSDEKIIDEKLNGNTPIEIYEQQEIKFNHEFSPSAPSPDQIKKTIENITDKMEENNLERNKITPETIDKHIEEKNDLIETEKIDNPLADNQQNNLNHVEILTEESNIKHDEDKRNSDESRSPESTRSTSTIKLAPLKKSYPISPLSFTQETPKGSVRSIKFDEKSLKSQKSLERLVRPLTPYSDGKHPIITNNNKKTDDDLEEDLLETTTPDFADSLEHTPKPNSNNDNSPLPSLHKELSTTTRNWINSNYNVKTDKSGPAEKVEDITTKSCGNNSYIIKQRYTEEQLRDLDDDIDDDDEELEVEVNSTNPLDKTVVEQIRFINDGVDVTENITRKLAKNTTDFIETEINKSKEILNTPDNSDKSKQKTVNTIEDDERTTASANSNKTGGNPFENDLDDNCEKELSTENNNIDVGGKGRKNVRRFINGIKNTGKGISCRTCKSVRVEDEPPKYTPVDEHLEEKTSKVCTIL